MEIKEMEDTLKLIRERENYLIQLQRRTGKSSHVSYFLDTGIIGGRNIFIFTLSDKEKEYLRLSCLKEIKRLRQSIECLTDE